MQQLAFDTVEERHWFGTATLPGEPTAHPTLMITPTARTELRDHDRQLRFTGGFSLIHTLTGHEVTAGFQLPLEWLRRFARLLATTTIDWNHLTGDTRLVTHPDHATIRDIGEYVLNCWVRGTPVATQLLASLTVDDEQYYGLSCANPHCEDDSIGFPAVLIGFGDGQDEIQVLEHQLDELYAHARACGWSRLDDREHWLCETCTSTHQPAPEHIARRVRSLTS